MWRPEVAPGERSPDRLRLSGFVVRPGRRAGAAGVGVRDGAGRAAGTCSCVRCCAWTSAPGSAAHVAAFEFFGGVPARLVPDNLQHRRRSKPDLYDPKLNRAYAELAAHYGCLIDPARASKPKDKPRVERPMPYVRDSFWRGREWDSVDDMQTAALALVSWRSPGAASTAPWRARSPRRCSPRSKPTRCRALPAEPFELARVVDAPRSVPDCHVKVGRALYSVPWRLIGRSVDARESDRTVEVFVDGHSSRPRRRVERGRPDRLRRLPAREGRVLHAHPGVVPPSRRRARPRRRRAHRRAAGDQRAAPAALRAGHHRPRRTPRRRRVSTPRAAGRSTSATRPIARSRASSPPAPKPSTRRPTSTTATVPAHLHGPARLFAITDNEVAS